MSVMEEDKSNQFLNTNEDEKESNSNEKILQDLKSEVTEENEDEKRRETFVSNIQNEEDKTEEHSKDELKVNEKDLQTKVIIDNHIKE